MSIEKQIDESFRVLHVIEDGLLDSHDIFLLLEKQEPVMVYFIIRYLREKYPAANPSSLGVLNRLVELTSNYEEVVTTVQTGSNDILREWFDDSHQMREFFGDSREFIKLVIEKLEG